MATVPYTVENVFGGVKIATWVLSGGDDGVPFVSPMFADKAVQADGTFGGTVTIEGSNYTDTGTAVYATLNDPQGSALLITVASVRQILENTYLVRPRMSAGGPVTVKIQFSTPTAWDVHVT